MITILDTGFDMDENKTLSEFVNRFNMEIAVFYSVRTESLSGVNNPNRMISVGGLYLLEEKDEPKSWYMGQLINGVIDFWGNYGSLHDALNGL